MTAKPIPILDLRKPLTVGKRTLVAQRILGRGGSGEVYYVEEGNRKLALKLFFPFYKVQQQPLLTSLEDDEIKYELSLQSREYDFLSTISHPNVAKVIENGFIPIPKSQSKRLPIKNIDKLPYLITEFIDGEPLNAALVQIDLSAHQIAQIFERLADALQHVHAVHKYLHTDVKSANILIRKTDFQPVLIDFALAKNLNSMEVNLAETTKLVGDWDLFPKELSDTDRLKQIKEKDGRRQEILDLAFPALDLYQFGLVLKNAVPLLVGRFEPREIEYIELLVSELTSWKQVRKWSEKELLPRVNRLGPGRYTFFGVPELTTPTGTERTIMIPPGQAVPITREIQKIIDTRSFRRLGRINQLSLLSFVYPGAEYKRRLHVLYSYELTRSFVYHLYATPVFRFFFDEVATRQLLVCALLHDINHFPFLHTFQESRLPGLEKAKLLDLFCSGELTGETALNKPSIYEILEDFGIDPKRFKRILFDKPTAQDSEVDQAISSILNSGVDVDKLSYLFYDSYFTGVNYGKSIDYVGLFRAAQLARVEENNCLHLCYSEGAIQALENVVMTRYWNFRSLYWHHTNRALMAMVLHVVREIFITNKKRANWEEYLRETLWLDEISAIRWLNDRYRESHHKESILYGLAEDRNRLFRRLYTVRVGPGAERDTELHKKLSRLGLDGEKYFRTRLADRLGRFIAEDLKQDIGAPISTDEVLIDIPRRDMDSGGDVYVQSSSGTVRLLEHLSSPVASIHANYQMLAKRARIFISPRISAAVDKSVRGEKREIIGRWLFDLLKDQGESEVQ